MDKRDNTIKGLEYLANWLHGKFEQTGEGDYELDAQTAENAIELLKALDVTPEELERLKKCRHECKIDCLLEHYERIKDERDALLKEKVPRLLTAEDFENNPKVDQDGFLPCWVECNEKENAAGVRLGLITEGENLNGWTEVQVIALPGQRSHNPNVRYWTGIPTKEQMEAEPWATKQK